MRSTTDEVLEGKAPTLNGSTVAAATQDLELEMLRQQRVHFDGYFTGPTW